MLHHDHFALLGLIDPPNKYYADELRKSQEASRELIQHRYGDLLDDLLCQMVRTVDERDCPVTVIPVCKIGIHPRLWATLNELAVMDLIPPMPELGITITDLDGDTAIISDKLEYIPSGASADYEAGDGLLPRHTRSVEFNINDYVSRQPKGMLGRIDRASLRFAIHQALPIPLVKYPDMVIECQPDARWVHDMKGSFNNTKALLRKGITVKPNLIGK